MAKIQKKPSNISMLSETLTKSVHWSDFLSAETMRLYPSNDDWRKRLIHTLYSWIDEKDEKGRPVLEVMQFCQSYKIPWRTLKRYADKYEDVGNAYNDIKEMLASRRRVGVAHKDYSESVFKDMHLYDAEWGPKVNEYWSKLKKDDADTKGTIIVHIPPIESTGKIKPKKEKKNDQ